jgi:hypothetical protein
MKCGLKVFGEDGSKAVSKEMQQLHDRKVMDVKHSRDLTPEERKDALASLPHVLKMQTLRKNQGTRLR